MLLLAALFLAVPAWSAVSVPVVFQASDEGGFPTGWRAQTEGGRANYTVRREDGRTYVHAESRADTCAIGLEKDVDPAQTPWLSFTWRAVELPQGADERTRATSDSGLGVYVAFDGWSYPPRTLKYVWSTSVPAGTWTPSPFAESVKIVVLRSGRAEAGRWVAETVNVADDYRRLFGEKDVPRVRAIGVLTGSENTRSRAVGEYGGFEFAQGPPPREAAQSPSAAEIFALVDAPYTRVSTLGYSVRRTVTGNGTSGEDQWTYRWRRPDSVRVDYVGPYERTIILAGGQVVEYIPAARKAVITDLPRDPASAGELIRSVMGRLSVDGLRVGDAANLAARTTAVREAREGGREVYLLEGARPRYAMTVDRERLVLTRMEVYDAKDDLVLKTESSDFLSAGAGLWLPRRIKVQYRSEAGYVTSVFSIRDARADAALSDELFRFERPAGVEVVHSSRRGEGR